MMMQALWLTGMMFANQWAVGELGAASHQENGTSNGAVPIQSLDKPDSVKVLPALKPGGAPLVDLYSPTIPDVRAAMRKEVPPATMTIDDVLKMSQPGIAHPIIVRQMELENAVFNLTSADIIRLHQGGVSEGIIRTMQERRAPTAVAPTIIQASALEAPIPKRVPNQMGLAEIVRLREIGTPDDSILQLVGVTRSVFTLSAHDIAYLREHGVSEKVIRTLTSVEP